MHYFNTSHVTVYQYLVFIIHTTTKFQYISCYCLSHKVLFLSCHHTHFNTSHVTVYLIIFIHLSITLHISIHLMLLFIVSHNSLYFVQLQFQYISCYCLSQKFCLQSYQCTLFQYISCYCLSSYTYFCSFFEKQFQYISCYCLSYTYILASTAIIYFNTSHVTVYQRCSCFNNLFT